MITNEDLNPPHANKMQTILSALAATDEKGKLYTDLMGKFLIMSESGMKCMLVTCHYNINDIQVTTMKGCSDTEMLDAYTNYMNTRAKHNG
eukprot:2124370-Ditylum_brightwellii.AAC.1